MKAESNFVAPKQRIPVSALAMPLLWGGGILVCAALALFLNPASAGPLVLTMALIAGLPAVLSLLISPLLDEDWAQALVILSWTVMAGFAVASAGSMSTSFVVLFILPIAAAHSLGGPRLTMEAAALTMFAVALVVAMSAGGLLPPVLIVADPVGLIEPVSIIMTLIASASALVVRRQGGWDSHSARLRLLQLAPDPLMCMDKNGRTLAASPAALEILGKSKRLTNALDGAHRARFAAAAGRVLRSGRREDVEVDMPAIGTKKPTSLELRLARDGDALLLVSMNDITKRAEREERLMKERDAALEAVRQKSQFLAGISHELRTPLNAIIGFSDMMKARLFGPLPSKYAEYADLIYDSGRHLVDLVGDVLDMSKIEADRYELNRTGFDARELVNSGVKLMGLGAEEAGVKLSVHTPNGAVPVYADRKALRQILFNLLSNAIKFTSAGGNIKVSLSMQGADALIAVSDDGVGMSPEDAARIGKPYEQAASAQVSEARGTGLGMSLVKSLSALHHGSMNVQSVLGQGTNVCVRLPIIDGAALGLGELAELDVRDHIRRAQEASEEIASTAKKIANG